MLGIRTFKIVVRLSTGYEQIVVAHDAKINEHGDLVVGNITSSRHESSSFDILQGFAVGTWKMFRKEVISMDVDESLDVKKE